MRVYVYIQDKIYAQNKLKALYANSQDEPHHDLNKLCEDVKFATWSPGRDASGPSLSEKLFTFAKNVMVTYDSSTHTHI